MTLALRAFTSLGLLGQLDQRSNVSELLRNVTEGRVIDAVLSLLLAYGLIFGGQMVANWLSERVPRGFRLNIKQTIPYWKGAVLLTLIVHLSRLFLAISEQNLLAVTGTLAVALGFAFKDYVTSIIAGVVALFEAPYRVGDRIAMAGYDGEVIRYGLRGIQLQTFDNDTITIPHGKTWTEPIVNANGGNLEAQVATDFYFDHQADIRVITEILTQAAYSSRFIQLRLPVAVVVTEQPWGTQVKLRAYPMDIRNEPAFRTDVVCRAKAALATLKVPYPPVPPRGA